jgi:hypothetical protein
VITPDHKKVWCDTLPVRMRLLGWPEEACRGVSKYVNQVRHVFTGRAWYSYTLEVDRFLEKHDRRNVQTLIAHFPRRMSVGRNLDVMA